MLQTNTEMWWHYQMLNAWKASWGSHVVKRFEIRCKVIIFHTIKETISGKSVLLLSTIFFRTKENFSLSLDSLTKLELNQRYSFHMTRAAKPSL